MAKISRDIPLFEITLRRYEKPKDIQKRDLVKKLCLSSGLLQPGDSRDIIVDVLHVLLDAKKSGALLSSEAIKEHVVALRQEHQLPLHGVASSNIRRQIKRLRDIFLVEKIKNNYRITEFDSVSSIFSEKIEHMVLHATLARVREYTDLIDEQF